MSTQRAIVHKSKGVVEVKSDVPLPRLRDDYILVKTKAVALNPTDWKAVEGRPDPGAISGCDYAGVVEEVGKNVTTPFKKGDRVAGMVHGANSKEHEDGAFAEHIAAKGDMQILLGDNISFEEGATLGVGITTVGQGLFQDLGLPLPPAKVQEPTSILIYGGSTATGTLAIQYAKLVGCEVITTSSPHNFDLCKKLGADQVFDYRDPDVGSKIRSLTNNTLKLAYDTIAEKGSPAICAAALSSSPGGHYSTLLPVKDFPRNDVKNTVRLAYTALGYSLHFAEQVREAKPEDWEFAVKFWRLTEGLLNNGAIKAHPAEVRKGLEGVPQGLKDLKDGKVSGVKMVYTVE